MNKSTDQYIHGTSNEEQYRLSLLNDLLNQSCLREMRLEGGEKILDVGSGLGQFSRAMARAIGGKGSVLGIERDEKQLEEAKLLAKQANESHLLTFRQGDATQLPLSKSEWESFDVVHTRFVLEHLRHPEKAVKQMVKAAKIGGRVIVSDDDHVTFRVTPEPAGFTVLWNAYMRTYDRLGNDPYIGRRLVSLLYRAGVRQIRNTILFFGDCAGNSTFEAYADNMIGVIAGAKDFMLSEALIDAYTYERGMEALLDWKKLPDAALWYGLCWAEGVKVVE